jgi:hypothetical protein
MMADATHGKIMPENKLTPEAQRALEEAEERRKTAQQPKLPKEINGRSGPEPTRFGDWENKGITSDF